MNTSFGDETICQICGKPAIGLEILGCCKAVVCFDHASPTLANWLVAADMNVVSVTTTDIEKRGRLLILRGSICRMNKKN
jgi:hypothetical protein